MRPAAARPIRPEDVGTVVDLCLAARSESSFGPQLCTDDADRLRQHIGSLAGEPDVLALVGTLDDEVCGLLLAARRGANGFTDDVTLAVEAVYVADRARRRGVGHALLTAVAREADRLGATEVYAVPLPGARGVRRFLARLGFAPVAAHRVVPVEILHRRLGPERPAAPVHPARAVDALVARRRLARAAGTRDDGHPTVLGVQPVPGAQSYWPSSTMQVNRAVQIRRPRGSSTTTS